MPLPRETQQPAKAGTGARFWPGFLFSAVLIPVLLFGIVEIGLRLCGVGRSIEVLKPCTDHGRAGFCDNPAFTTAFFPVGMARTPRPFFIPADKPPGTIRVFILGESAAYGDPDPTFGFPRYLEVMLRERFPQKKFEIINMGTTAINSHVLLPIAKELAHHQPDLFIIYAGNNEAVGPFGPGTVLTRSGMNLSAIRATILFRSTRVGQLLSMLGASEKPQNWRGMQMFLDKQIPADSPLMDGVYKNYASNLSGIISTAQGAGAKVIVGTVATSLKDCAPFASSHRVDLTQDALASWVSLVERGSELEAAQAYDEALRVYRQAEQIDNQHAELEFRIARCLWKIGSYTAARNSFIRARDLDVLRFRADSKINEVNRFVAASFPGVSLLDTETLFAQESPNGVVGGELIYEHVHPTPKGSYLLARALFDEVSRILATTLNLEDTTGLQVPSQEDCERLLAFTRFDKARVAQLVLRKIEEQPFTSQLNYSEELQRIQAAGEVSPYSYDEILDEYRWAIAKNPDDRLLYLNCAFLVNMRDPSAASELFRQAMPYDDAPVLCNWRRFN